MRKKLFEEQGWSCACPSDVGFVEGLKCSLFCAERVDDLMDGGSLLVAGITASMY